MAVLTILGLYPTMLVVSTLVSALLQEWPRPLLSLVNMLILLPLLTYSIMPLITRCFRSWLYPPGA